MTSARRSSMLERQQTEDPTREPEILKEEKERLINQVEEFEGPDRREIRGDHVEPDDDPGVSRSKRSPTLANHRPSFLSLFLCRNWAPSIDVITNRPREPIRARGLESFDVMSFILRKKPATTTPSSSASRVSREGTPSLPAELVAAGGQRLATMGIIAASVSVLMAVVDWHTFSQRPLPANAQTLWLAAVIAEFLISVAVAWIAFREMVAPETLLDLGLLFEVALALCISISFHAVPIQPDLVSRGWTPVAVWIIAYPLIVPASRGKALLATVASAAMDPLGLGIQVLAGNPKPTAATGSRMFLTTFVSAAVALIV